MVQEPKLAKEGQGLEKDSLRVTFPPCRKRVEPARPGDPAAPPGDEAELPPGDHLPGGLGPALRAAGPGPLHPAHPLPQPLRPESVSCHRAAALPHHTGRNNSAFVGRQRKIWTLNWQRRL